MDTSGDMQFPAMRRLSVATAHAFLLVYATTSAPSFSCIKQCFEEIREQRPDYQVNFIFLYFKEIVYYFLLIEIITVSLNSDYIYNYLNLF